MDNNLELGFDAETEEAAEVEEAVFPDDNRISTEGKRRPFILWTVGGADYKLKLSTSTICKLEQKYKKNLLLLITENDLVPISVMLTVIQAAMMHYHHGIKIHNVQHLYDIYVSEGGDQLKLLGDVIMPLMGASGFFTQSQMDVLTEEIKEMDLVL